MGSLHLYKFLHVRQMPECTFQTIYGHLYLSKTESLVMRLHVCNFSRGLKLAENINMPFQQTEES